MFCDRCGSPVFEGSTFCDECGAAVVAVEAHAVVATGGYHAGAELLDWLLRIATLGIGWWVWSILLWSKGQTPAYSLLRLKVAATETNRTARPGRMALREIVVRRFIIVGTPVVVVLLLVATIGHGDMSLTWWLALLGAYLAAVVFDNAFALGAGGRPLHDRLAWTSVSPAG